MGKISFYNTLTRKKEEFTPMKKGHAGIYSCGPTVYSWQHIGNMRAYIFADLLRRCLEYNRYKTKHIINVTDVGHLTSDGDYGEDKMEKAAEKEGRRAEDLARYYYSFFVDDLKKLNVMMPTKWVWASKHIKEQIELIKKLERKGYTYKTKDGIYFDSSKFKNYGKLARLNLSGLKAGKRVDIGEKKSKTDFALWKFSSPEEKRQQEWDSPWGVGFPGWHIECSAMSMKYLGEHFDIHTGGEDHIPVHHTNEIAQSEAATDKKFANYWLHNAFLVDEEGKKVSKSRGGLYTISELEEKEFKPEHFRYFCLLTHYRKPLTFTLDNLDAAKKAYERIFRKIIGLRDEKHKGKDFSERYRKDFLEAVNDDLNMPKAIQVLIEALDDFDFDPRKKLKLLEDFDNVLGLGIKGMKEKVEKIPMNIRKLVRAREAARAEKDWERADLLREEIAREGFLVEDSPKGSKLSKI